MISPAKSKLIHVKNKHNGCRGAKNLKGRLQFTENLIKVELKGKNDWCKKLKACKKKNGIP